MLACLLALPGPRSRVPAGDARILIAAVQAGARKGVGVDIDPNLAEVACARVVSNDFGMGDWMPDRTVQVETPGRVYTLYLWTITNEIKQKVAADPAILWRSHPVEAHSWRHPRQQSPWSARRPNASAARSAAWSVR